MDTIVHPTAIVEPGARLGSDVEVGPFCHVGADVELGAGVRLLSHVVLAGRTTIGARTRIFPFASIGHEPQDLKYRGEPSTLTVGADCLVREGVTMNPGTAGGGLTTIVGDRCTFLANAHVAHDCRIGNDVILSNNVMLAGHTHIGDFVILGGGAAVHQFVRIGAHAFVAGLAGVGNDVIPYGTAFGYPAYLAGLNLVGLKRRAFSREAIHDLRRAYRLLFAAEGTLQERVTDVAAEFAEHPQVHEILDFIRNGGERAIVTPREGKDFRRLNAAEPERPLAVFVVAGEQSGDDLGGRLLQALRAEHAGGITFRGVGGPAMIAQGLPSLFPLADIAVMGFLPVVARLPTLLARIRATVQAVLAEPPDVLVLIDSPDFTHRVAKRVRARLPTLPILDYVSPTVWAWRPWRARTMARSIDHVLALLPFEPEAHRRLGGPACSYVGHPLIERLDMLRPDRQARARTPPILVVLPGSRRAEIERLCTLFGEAAALAVDQCGPLDIVVPAVPHLAQEIAARVRAWPVAARVVTGEAEKYAVFRAARAALAASGTVTLELALAQVPMVVAYRVSRVEEMIVRALVNVSSIVLPNIILGRDVIPQKLQGACTPHALAAALSPLLRGGPERSAQDDAFVEIAARMTLAPSETPSSRAAALVLRFARNGRAG